VVPRGESHGATAQELGLEVLYKAIEVSEDLPGLGVALKFGKWMYNGRKRHEAEFAARDLGLWPIECGGRIDLQDLEGEDWCGVVRGPPRLSYETRGTPFTSTRGWIGTGARLRPQTRHADHLQQLFGYCVASPDRAVFDRLRVIVFSREILRWDVLYAPPDWPDYWRQVPLTAWRNRTPADISGGGKHGLIRRSRPSRRAPLLMRRTRFIMLLTKPRRVSPRKFGPTSAARAST
jgi:hypothetical protein